MHIVLLIRVLRCTCNPASWLQLVLINKLQTDCREGSRGFKLQSGLTLTVSNRLKVVPFYDGCYDGWTFYSSRIGTINGELLCFFFLEMIFKTFIVVGEDGDR